MSSYQIWNRYMQCYDFLAQVDSYARNIQDVAALAAARPGVRILDAGSGTGNLSLVLKGAGARVVSCDFSESALARHRQKDPEAQCVRASLEEPLPFDDAGFDAVCCVSVLFALTRGGCQLALSEFHRVLCPGGKLIVTVPAPNQRNKNLIGLHFRGLTGKHGRIQGWCLGLMDLPQLLRILYYNRQLGHLPDWQGFHRFSEEELREFLRRAGFEGIEIGRTYGDCFFLIQAQKGGVRREAASVGRRRVLQPTGLSDALPLPSPARQVQ